MDSEYLHVMTWNIGFSSRKVSFIKDDSKRAEELIKFIHDIQKEGNIIINAIAFQEIANRVYIGLNSFYLSTYLNSVGINTKFVPALSLGENHSYPYGKIKQLNEKFDISFQEQGIGLGIPDASEKWNNSWKLQNLYSDDHFYLSKVEISKPLPYPLYMGNKPHSSAGRDEEDRPVLWSRINKIDQALISPKVYFCSIHLPTLKNEEKNVTELNETQKNIAENILNIEVSKDNTIIDPQSNGTWTIDNLGTKLRLYMLRQIVFQTNYIEKYWNHGDNSINCVFILAGDFNFYHNQSSDENEFLSNNGFKCCKTTGISRPTKIGKQPRLIDNIWVKGANISEYTLNGNQIEQTQYLNKLDIISDHYPVIGKITL